MNLSDPQTIRSILSRHGFSFSKGLGQNFLIDPSVCPSMAEACGADKEIGVLEIGPGIGVLTKELCSRAQKVTAVELDHRLLPVLSETLSGFSNLHVIEGDILKLDLPELLKAEFPGLKIEVCANLPYYITSPVIMGLLEADLPIDAMTVMVQKEAAERLCAIPGTRACGSVSAAVWFYSEPEILFPVKRNCFLPSPKVDSTVIQLRIRSKPPIDVPSQKAFFRTVHACFSQRRKTVLNSLSAGLSLPKDKARQALSEAKILENRRAEQLSMDEFAALTRALSKGEII